MKFELEITISDKEKKKKKRFKDVVMVSLHCQRYPIISIMENRYDME